MTFRWMLTSEMRSWMMQNPEQRLQLCSRAPRLIRYRRGSLSHLITRATRVSSQGIPEKQAHSKTTRTCSVNEGELRLRFATSEDSLSTPAAPYKSRQY